VIVALDAVRALRDVRDGHCDELLRLLVEGAFGEDGFAELIPGGLGLRGQLAAKPRQLGGHRVVDGVAHGFPFLAFTLRAAEDCRHRVPKPGLIL
jgi:hypothetical protein